MRTTILVDAGYLDSMAFDITVNFERMLERRINKLDLSRWVDYVALDAGLRPGDPDAAVQVVMVYSPKAKTLKNCLPANLDTELNATAIRTNIAEFSFASCCAEEDFVSVGDLYCQSLSALANDEDTQLLALVGDTRAYGSELRQAIGAIPHGKDVILFAPEAVAGFRCRQEILTYSIMAAMDIKSEEII